jgi:hypothetical protein
MKKGKKTPRKFALQIQTLVDKFKFIIGVKPKGELIILSGADSSHFKSLIQLTESILRYESTAILVIYDLGLTNKESSDIKERFPFVDFKKFDYSRYPSYFNIKENAGHYAWKPVIISAVLNEYKKPALWLDAGCVITHPLYRIRKIIKSEGFYYTVCSSKVKDWTHPKTLEYLDTDQTVLSKGHLAGGIVGFDYENYKARDLLEKWRQAAFCKEITAPEGWCRSQHRAQSVLTILAYNNGMVSNRLYRRLGIKVHQDID